jgi:hypothetical protein
MIRHEKIEVIAITAIAALVLLAALPAGVAAVTETIFEDDFQPGNLDKWSKTGSVVIITGTSDRPPWTPSSNKFVQFNDNTNKLYTSINTIGRENIRLSYARQTEVAAGEYFEVEYSTDGGSSWSSLEQRNNNTWENVTYPLSAAADNNPDLRIRFWLHDGQGGGEAARLDTVLVTGEPIPPPIEAPALTPTGLVSLATMLSILAAVTLVRKRR